MEKATFAGGCFWCMVTPFEELPGIEGIVSGYMGGHVDNPTYEQVKTGTTGHLEVVQITFDPSLFPYERLLELYWPQTDPTDAEGQFQDRGTQYAPAIFYHTDSQHEAAIASRDALAASNRFKQPIVTRIDAASEFYPAEEYHQDFHKKNPEHYKKDRAASGRDAFIEQEWKDTTTV
ncbi:peptide-methionine (S)-S-oxide reductase MsrA [uncultured Exiguobacterium sp.]|uniref:peptide-methionine (S)-S-oxide reductase MsrA n=1 Tax=uncultured Exiguobacterium sp. TaxID=202669 RepID=UPI0025CC6584|nr:peptide-methionine (S)-S-oxide reductase MsrA [uncultured Exiguobacterium sp.]